MTETMTIKVCPGIGDNIWLLMKLIATKEKYHWRIQDGQPRRGKPLFDMVPHLVQSVAYEPIPGGYKTIKTRNIQRAVQTWKRIKGSHKNFYLSANDHLERGLRIENFLPDLQTHYRINYFLDGARSPLADDRLWIGLYGSSYSTSRAWGFWGAQKWFELAQMIHRHDPVYSFAIIGADFDTDLNSELCAMLQAAGIPHHNCTGFTLQETAATIQQLHYFYAFPSGLPILAHTMGKPCTMFYPPHLAPMINAWARPEDIESGFYKGCLFCEPEPIFEWTKKNKWI